MTKSKWLVLSALTACVAFAQNAPKLISSPISRDAAASVANYWTPDQLASAVPMDLLDGNSMAPGPAGASGGPELSSPGQAPALSPSRRTAAARSVSVGLRPSSGISVQGYNYPYPYTSYNVESFLYDESLGFVDYPQSAIGKLFFTLGGSNFVCSASVLRPHILLTARHCVYDTATGQFATNVVFYPGWHSGPNAILNGAWIARQMGTWSGRRA